MSSEIDVPRPYLGALFRLVWQWMRDQIAEEVRAAGYAELRSAHVLVFRYPGPDGLRPSELGAQLQLSKQSINDLLGHLEQGGYLRRAPDPADGRARVVRLTAKGRRLERKAREAAYAAERRLVERIGPRETEALRKTLERLARDITTARGVDAD
ncbi:MAG: MarR family transcriptional regulator [Spirochaetaceae bacterium]|nr:MarR family transcriptional regulator [Myxococcales bacterium]MCB9722861.1 MarR family transcriptional regulator [Spirochaetaceae bacterium]